MATDITEEDIVKAVNDFVADGVDAERADKIVRNLVPLAKAIDALEDDPTNEEALALLESITFGRPFSTKVAD